MDVEIRRQRIQEELKTCIGGLTRSDRRLISTFLGYLPIVGIREKKKDWQVSPIYVRSNIFPFLMEEKERNESEKLSEKSEEIEWETKPFEMSEINFWEDKYFPSIFRRDKDSMTKFLAEEGIGLNSIEECSLVRTFQVSEKKNPVTDGNGRSRTVTDGHGRSRTVTDGWAGAVVRKQLGIKKNVTDGQTYYYIELAREGEVTCLQVKK